MLTHNKDKPFVCSVCDRKYVKKVKLERHVMEVHKNKGFIRKVVKCDLGEFTCDKCLDRFALETELKAHSLTHNAKTKPFSCTICKSYHRSITALESHIMAHTDEELKSCLHCEKKYDYKYLLLNHLMTHTNVKPFSCAECGQRFRQKSILAKHILRHENTKDTGSKLSIVEYKQSSKNANETINTPRNVIDKTLHASSSSIVSKHKKHESKNISST